MKNYLIYYLFITLSIIVNSCNEGFKDEPIKYSYSDDSSGSGVFLLVGHSGTILKSTDNGVSFSTVTSGTSSNIRGVGFGNNTFVLVGASGTILRSTDYGATFSTVTSGTTKHLNDVTFGNNTFVAGGTRGTILRSTDNGLSFSTVTSGTSQELWGAGF